MWHFALKTHNQLVLINTSTYPLIYSKKIRGGFCCVLRVCGNLMHRLSRL